jgi:hypothetical protein
MKFISAAAAVFVSFLTIASIGCAQGTAFTYQGRLNNGGQPASGNYDMAFTLFATNSSGVAIAGPVTNSAIAVSNGLFTTMINFSPGVFTGGSNWLQIAVSTNGANNFIILTPRQQVTPVPYAVFANTASNVTGTVSAFQLSGTIPTGLMPGFQSPYATIGGGTSNISSSSYSTVSGGESNQAYNGYSTVGGGLGNTANAYAAVGGGLGNNASNTYAVVGGGLNNTAGYLGTVPGGQSNVASGQFSFAAGNQAQATNQGSFVWADSQNTPFTSTNNDSFNVRAQGGVRFVTGGAGMNVSVTTPNQGVTVANQNASGVGLLGANTAATSTGSGVGVEGNTSQSAGYGVLGQNLNASGIGILGGNTAASSTGSGIGVEGYTSQSAGFGVIGQNLNPNGTGIIATGNGVLGQILVGGSGLAASGSATGIFARNTSAAANTEAIYTINNGNTVLINYWSGSIQYKINGNGTVSTIVSDRENQSRVMFAPEAPEVFFEDYGNGRLTNGTAHIALDPVFTGNIAVDESHPLRVFVQVEGDCNGVYVTGKSDAGFDVSELGHGTSAAPFSWHAVANRADEASNATTKNAKGVAMPSRISHYSTQRFPTNDVVVAAWHAVKSKN